MNRYKNIKVPPVYRGDLKTGQRSWVRNCILSQDSFIICYILLKISNKNTAGFSMQIFHNLHSISFLTYFLIYIYLHIKFGTQTVSKLRVKLLYLLQVPQNWCRQMTSCMADLSDSLNRCRLSTLVQILACCLTAPSHYLNQCWMSTLVQIMACCYHYLNQCEDQTLDLMVSLGAVQPVP